MQLIECIEVYRGVVPARFGGDGLGAAINVVSPKPAGGYTDEGYTIGSLFDPATGQASAGPVVKTSGDPTIVMSFN